jgi:hypothetical protein
MNIAQKIVLGFALIVVTCSYSFMPGWKVAKDPIATQYCAYAHQLPMDCYLYENFDEYRMDESGRSIPFIVSPSQCRYLPKSIEWYRNHTQDWKELLCRDVGVSVYKYNILGVLDAGTTFHVLKVYECAHPYLALFSNPYFNRDCRRLLVEIVTGPFAGYRAILVVYIDGNSFQFQNQKIS